MKYFFVVALVFGFSFCLFAENESRENELEGRILDLELELAEKKILDVSGRLQTLYKSFSTRDMGTEDEQLNLDLVISSLELSFNKVSDPNLKIYSTVGAKYFWNNNFQGRSDTEEGGAIEVKGSYLYLSRSYFDYFSDDKKYAISMGRLPTTNGPPVEKPLGKSRLGTYPVLLYSVPLDGVGVTFNMRNIFSMKNRMIARLIYSPFYNFDSFDERTSVGVIHDSSLKTTSGEAFYANMETSGEVKGWFDYSLIVQGYHTRFGRPRARAARGVAETTCQSGGSAGGLCGATAGPDGNQYEIYSDDNSMASIDALVFHFDLGNLKNTGLGLYGSLKKAKFTKKGDLSAVLVEQNNGGAASPGTSLGEIGGFLYNEDQESTEYLLGAKYSFRRNSIGYEYLHRTLGAIPAAVQTYTFTEFYNVVGYAQHFYYNRKISNGMSFNLGYMHMMKESVLSGITYSSADYRVDGYYANMLVNF